MVIIKYDNPKRFKETQWFVTSLIKGKEPANGFRFFEDDPFLHGYFNLVSFVDMPAKREFTLYGSIVSNIPDDLKWNLFNALFGDNAIRFNDLKNLLSANG